MKTIETEALTTGGQTKQIVVPFIHLNGTSRERLLEAVGRAIGDALDKVCEAAPNARDYYLADGAFEQARREHEAHASRSSESFTSSTTRSSRT